MSVGRTCAAGSLLHSGLLHLLAVSAAATEGPSATRRHRGHPLYSATQQSSISISTKGSFERTTIGLSGNSMLQTNRKTARAHEFLSTSNSQNPIRRIPDQLILTGKWASLADVTGPVVTNLQNTLALNPDLHVRWLSDASCEDYLAQHFDKELAEVFAKEQRGSFRGDICRAAVLSREGGFYTDLDVEWLAPMRGLVDEATTFMSSYGEGKTDMLNAVIAAEPRSKIMQATLKELRDWYRPDSAHHGWMGPATLFKGLQAVQQESCAEVDLTSHSLEKVCGPHKLRLYEQRNIHCHDGLNHELHSEFPLKTDQASGIRVNECPPSRANSNFDGLQYGLFEPGPDGKLVGWPRFAECGDWGCGGGGWSVGKAKIADPLDGA